MHGDIHKFPLHKPVPNWLSYRKSRLARFSHQLNVHPPHTHQWMDCHKFLDLCSGVSEASILLGFDATSIGNTGQNSGLIFKGENVQEEQSKFGRCYHHTVLKCLEQLTQFHEIISSCCQDLSFFCIFHLFWQQHCFPYGSQLFLVPGSLKCSRDLFKELTVIFLPYIECEIHYYGHWTVLARWIQSTCSHLVSFQFTFNIYVCWVFQVVCPSGLWLELHTYSASLPVCCCALAMSPILTQST